MTHQKRDEENPRRETPSQAEGERDTVNAALNPADSDRPEQDLVRRTPSQAEGSEEMVDEILEERKGGTNPGPD
jgi:hypothetical protein